MSRDNNNQTDHNNDVKEMANKVDIQENMSTKPVEGETEHIQYQFDINQVDTDTYRLGVVAIGNEKYDQSWYLPGSAIKELLEEATAALPPKEPMTDYKNELDALIEGLKEEMNMDEYGTTDENGYYLLKQFRLGAEALLSQHSKKRELEVAKDIIRIGKERAENDPEYTLDAFLEDSEEYVARTSKLTNGEEVGMNSKGTEE